MPLTREDEGLVEQAKFLPIPFRGLYISICTACSAKEGCSTRELLGKSVNADLQSALQDFDIGKLQCHLGGNAIRWKDRFVQAHMYNIYMYVCMRVMSFKQR